VVTFGEGAIELTGNKSLPVDEASQMYINFFGPPRTFPTYSFRAVHDEEVNPALFRDRIVLVGVADAAGSTDKYIVPISQGDVMSGVEVHANILESILQSRPLRPQTPFARTVGLLLTAVLGSLLFSRVAWYLIPALVVFIAALIFLLASLAFSLWLQIWPLFDLFIALALVALGVLALNIRWEAQNRRFTQRLLDSFTLLDNQRLILNAVLPRIGDELARLFGNVSTAVWLVDDETKSLDPVFLRGARLAQLTANDVQTALNIGLKPGQAMSLSRSGQIIRIAPMVTQGQAIGVVVVNGLNADDMPAFARFMDGLTPVVSNSRRYTAQLRQAEMLSVTLTSSPDPILILAAPDQGAAQVNRLNDAAVTLLNPEAVPCTLAALLRKAGMTQADLARLEDTLSEDAPFHLEVRLGPRVFNLQGVRLRFYNLGWVLTLHDISSLRELDALKTQMLRMASHDLKNPLGVVMSYSELLTMTDDLNDTQAGYVGTIRSAADQMLSLIDDLLNLERFKAGRLDLTVFDFGDFMTRIVEGFAPQTSQKRQTLSLRRPEDPLHVEADRRQLREAFSNLIGNAIKYTPDGGAITVTLTQARDILRVAIVDNGYGIPPEAQKNLFQPFFRVRTRQTADIPGTGLGLSLTKAVIDSHGGKIWVESDEGKGSTFYVELNV
jgi:signal transduction histidine kinase